ncbi:MAG: hypothetical protein HYZ91_04325 [Candidatus Omnitrophica bacterium]|nr:hypothetical protein [Candidatus Omnitrophota bacterium]
MVGVLAEAVDAGSLRSGSAAESPQAVKPMTTDAEHVPPPVQVSGVGSWTVYRGQHGRLDVAFEYPQNWAVGAEEGREQPYWQVVILGPRNAKNTLNVSMVVRKLSTTAEGGLYDDFQALVETRRTQYAANHDFQLLGEGASSVSGVAARQSEFSYVVPLPPHSVEPKPTSMQTRLVQFAFRGALYELSYTADVNQYATYHNVFAHLLDTFTLNP